jgi:hypothetical protein
MLAMLVDHLRTIIDMRMMSDILLDEEGPTGGAIASSRIIGVIGI